MPNRLQNTHVPLAPAARALQGVPRGSAVLGQSASAASSATSAAARRASVLSLVATGTLLGLTALSGGCATTDAPKKDEGPITESAPKLTSVEVAEIEISGNGEDRFVSCPPAGELGQAWIPPIPAWSGGATSSSDASASSASQNGNVAAAPSPSASQPNGSPDGARAEAAAASRLATQSAITETFPDFRQCHYKGLRVDPTQDGHVAIVARVGASGAVEKVEEFGACNLSSDVIECMRASAGRLRFEPPPGGSMSVTIPAYFASLNGYKSNHATPNDAYTAAAYITIEQARPQLHACEVAARAGNKGIEASAALMIALDAKGRASSVHVDNWSGNQELLACAAQTFQTLTFDPPPAGRGSVLARVVFNPRAGSR